MNAADAAFMLNPLFAWAYQQTGFPCTVIVKRGIHLLSHKGQPG
ncbi:hypothetical protein [Spirosoma litoris]